MGKRKRPSAKSMGDSIDHAYDHQGDTGKYGDFFENGIEKWKVAEAEHVLMIIPYHISNAKKSLFRRNESLNKPFTSKDIKNDNCWDWKLSVLIHSGMGYNEEKIICPRTVNKSCPICEYVDTLDWDEEEELIRNLKCYKRGIVNVKILNDKKESKKGIQVWEAAHTNIIDAISRLARKGSDKGKKLFNILSENWDISFERQGAGKNNTKYLDLAIIKRKKKYRLSELKYEKLEKEAYNLEEIVMIKKTKEIEKLLNETLDGDESTSKKKKKKNKYSDDNNNNNDNDNNNDNNDNNNDDSNNDDNNNDDNNNDDNNNDNNDNNNDDNNNDDNNNDDNNNDDNNNDDNNNDDSNNDDGKEKKPKCYGIRANKEEDCDDCDHWTKCFKETEKRKKSKRKKK